MSVFRYRQFTSQYILRFYECIVFFHLSKFLCLVKISMYVDVDIVGLSFYNPFSFLSYAYYSFRNFCLSLSLRANTFQRM